MNTYLVAAVFSLGGFSLGAMFTCWWCINRPAGGEWMARILKKYHRPDKSLGIVFDTLAEVEAFEEAFVEQFYGPDAEPSACQRTLAGLRVMLENRLGYSPEAKK